MKHLALAAVAASAALFPMTADAWRALNRHEVYPLSNGAFEVVSEVGSGAQDFWCGAGDFAYRGLGAASAQRVYISRAIGPSVAKPGYKAVQFSLVAPQGAGTDPALTLSVRDVGDNMRAAAAQQYCFDNARPDRRFFP